MKKRFFTTSELAEICHVNPTTIFRAVSSRHLKAATTPGGHFRIPREEAEDFLKKNNIPLPAEKFGATRILVVEDNPTERRAFARLLSHHGFDVQCASSGYEAGFLTKNFIPDLILLDIYLGDINGRDVAKLLRKDPDLKHTKILAVTGEKRILQQIDLRSAGFDGVLFKPLSKDKLLRKIEVLAG